MKWMINYLEAKEQRLSAVHRQFGIEIRLAAQLLEKPATKEGAARIWRHLERAHILGQASAWSTHRSRRSLSRVRTSPKSHDRECGNELELGLRHRKRAETA